MIEEHGNFERLVVGHVLGELPDGDASRFRSHLIGCRDCRSRVAELRGIAADLADAERDELERARVRTEAPRRLDEDRVDTPRFGLGGRITVQHVTVAAIVVIVLAAAMGFWNLHLRASSSVYLTIAQDRSDTLATMAAGRGLDLELAAGVEGIAVSDGGQIAISLAGVEDADDGSLLVAWLLGGGDGTRAVALAEAGQLDGGRLATTIADAGATTLVITREQSPGDEPTGPELLRTRLREQ